MKSYEIFVVAYEVLVSHEVTDLDELSGVFSTINELLIQVETKVEEAEAVPPAVRVEASGSSDCSGAAAKLPLIHLGRFSGDPLE